MDGRRAAVRAGDRSGGREGRENRPPLYGHPQKACQEGTKATSFALLFARAAACVRDGTHRLILHRRDKAGTNAPRALTSPITSARCLGDSLLRLGGYYSFVLHGFKLPHEWHWCPLARLHVELNQPTVQARIDVRSVPHYSSLRRCVTGVDRTPRTANSKHQNQEDDHSGASEWLRHK
jgi:hypothetical protein